MLGLSNALQQKAMGLLDRSSGWGFCCHPDDLARLARRGKVAPSTPLGAAGGRVSWMATSSQGAWRPIQGWVTCTCIPGCWMVSWLGAPACKAEQKDAAGSRQWVDRWLGGSLGAVTALLLVPAAEHWRRTQVACSRAIAKYAKCLLFCLGWGPRTVVQRLGLRQGHR